MKKARERLAVRDEIGEDVSEGEKASEEISKI